MALDWSCQHKRDCLTLCHHEHKNQLNCLSQSNTVDRVRDTPLRSWDRTTLSHSSHEDNDQSRSYRWHTTVQSNERRQEQSDRSRKHWLCFPKEDTVTDTPKVVVTKDNSSECIEDQSMVTVVRRRKCRRLHNSDQLSCRVAAIVDVDVLVVSFVHSRLSRIIRIYRSNK